MALSPVEIQAIAEQTADRLAARNRADWVDPETHTKHHRWLATQMKREADFVELRQKIMTSACIWAIPIILAFTLTAIGRELLRLVKVGVGQ